MVIAELLLPFLVLALGLVVGSFGNVVIHRVPRRESIAFPGSRCPACGGAIPWYLNVPVLSWLVLRGRCRECSARISLRYPLVEAVTGLLFLAAWLRWGLSWASAAACLFGALTLFLALIDLEHQLLPDALTYPGIALGLATCWFTPWTTWRESLLGTVMGGLLPMAVLLFWEKILNRDGMGWGDVKLMAMVGAFLGWRGALLTLLLGSVLGTVVGGAWLALRRRDAQTPLPFGTFLGAAALITLYFGDLIWRWYAGFFPSGALP